MVGVFDSGVGGLTVVDALKKVIPGTNILYLGDTAHVPYGSKSPELITKYSIQNTRFLIERGAQVVVVGCHTASVVAGDALRQAFPKTKIYDVVGPALLGAIKATKNKKIGIIGTEATIASQQYEHRFEKLDEGLEIFSQACPLFVPLVEEGRIRTPETKRIIKSYLKPLKSSGIDTLILGCTHYPFLEQEIKKYFHRIGKDITVINPGFYLAQQLREESQKDEKLNEVITSGDKDMFYLTDYTEKFEEIAQSLFGKDIHFKEVVIN